MQIITGTATREGTALDNADAARVYVLADGAVGGAVIDGVGHGPHTSTVAPLLAEVAARIAAQRGPTAGLLTAGLLVADRGADGEEADAVGVAAIRRPYEDDTYIAWVGDCRAYGWDGTVLTRYTDDHTVGAQLARNGAPWELAKHHDNWLKTSLAKAVVGTVYSVLIPDDVVVLTSDGVHDQVEHATLEALVREHEQDPQALADALVAAAQANPAGYRDDATTVVLRCSE
ncbi:PP2C family protein-serine/threonine phosphatase [Streptomyces liangshanensis]|uniref:PP2C family protein-serine/threonine phosphatase n=1 Tax=Streptomyces liangshanensis TaxID=2717324 RepID=UPI0036DCE4E5